ncbi:hypothetical protein OROHE_006536 [Orobanche hederae]
MRILSADVEMAKAKRAKNEDQRGGDNSNSEAVIKHQKLCLSIDMDNRRIYGYTELQIVIPENGIVGLHADNLAIEKVTVDGDPAEFEVFPHYQHLDPKDRWCVVCSATSAADASGKTTKTGNGLEEHLQMDDGEPSSADASRAVPVIKHLRIEYWVEKTETGIHFNDNVLHTDNQLRRARCWFPCLDDNSQCCCYDLEFTVASNLVAVSSGTLLHQVLTKDDPPRKTYVYKLDVPVAARWISLAVAPFEIIPDRHGGLLSHFCLPSNLSKLRNTMVFFYNAFSHYEDYLSASFPFGSYTQVFIAPDMTLSSWSMGASISIFSSHLLFDEKIIDQTIETRIKLAYALATQWFGVYITPEDSNDEWLLDGLAGFLADSFIKRFLGNNEVRYRRYKANCAVCQADDSGATALSSDLASKDLYGTQCIGFYGKIRSWKSVAVLQMLEKQMGPESFRKYTKEFRHFANKIGNLERPFLKEFFPRWVESCGCPVLKMGFSYNKRKNMVELAVLRGCTSRPDSWIGVDNINPDSENREGGVGWPGMMSLRVHELDGMYDHPIIPMAGEPWQLLEIQCHSKLAAKRFQKPKKGSKNDGSDDNADAVVSTDVRLNSESPLLWVCADPEMEYLAEVHFNQPVQMWINQLERDKDVVAQAQAIAVLEALPQLPFSVVSALNNFLSDSKAFWRVRIQAAYALATTTSEDTDWTGLLHLINFYKSRRFDPNIALPRPNDFHDFQEYFVLEAIPHAVAMVRSSDKKSPREAVEFILQLLKYNDNSGNTYSDVFWVAALVQSVGELEFGQQSIIYLPSLLKRLDRLLQFDRLMPSHNGILTISCIQSLTQMALKLSEFIPLDRVIELIKPYLMSKTWRIRVAASKALLELESHCKGIDGALTLFINYLNNETSLRGQTKLGVCALRLSQMSNRLDCGSDVKSETLVTLLRLLESPLAFNNVSLRHYIYCILQVLAKRCLSFTSAKDLNSEAAIEYVLGISYFLSDNSFHHFILCTAAKILVSPTLYGVPRDETLRMGHTKTCSELKNIFAALITQSKAPDPFCPPDLPHNLVVPENYPEMNTYLENHGSTNIETAPAPDASLILATQHLTVAPDIAPEQRNSILYSAEQIQIMPSLQMPVESQQPVEQVTNSLGDADMNAEASVKADQVLTFRPETEQPVSDHVQDHMITKEATINEPNSNCLEIKKPKLKIRVKQCIATSRAGDPDNTRIMNTQASSSVSIDAPQKNFAETISTGNQNFEDVNSCQGVGSRVTASIGSAKPTAGSEDLVKELQCTADSSKVSLSDDRLPGGSVKIDAVSTSGAKKEKEKKRDKEKKRKRNGHDDDPERSERKRQKKEKKRKEKELAKLFMDKQGATAVPPVEVPDAEKRMAGVDQEAEPTVVELDSSTKELYKKNVENEMGEADVVVNRDDDAVNATPNDAVYASPNVVVMNRNGGGGNANPPSAPSHKIKIKFKNRMLGNR